LRGGSGLHFDGFFVFIKEAHKKMLIIRIIPVEMSKINFAVFGKVIYLKTMASVKSISIDIAKTVLAMISFLSPTITDYPDL
jgi:hypothetical protein